jgi:hypothetical protein
VSAIAARWHLAQHRHRADQQPQRPNRAAVGIHATGGRHHLLFAFATEAADGFAQRDIAGRCQLCWASA